MRRTIWILGLLAVTAAPGSAQERGTLGLGVMVGAPIGGTGKFWTGETQAIDFGIGFNGNLTLHADYLWHNWDVLPPPQEGKAGAYVGVGTRMRNREDDDFELGLRAPLGINYWMGRYPIEMFIELAPILKFNAHNALDLDGAVGLRFYFDKPRPR